MRLKSKRRGTAKWKLWPAHAKTMIVIENEGTAWGAYDTDIPGLGVAGSSREEVEVLVHEAIRLHRELELEIRNSKLETEC